MKNIPVKTKKVTKPSKFWFFAALTFIIFFWALVVHPFEFPDEQAHLGSVEFLRREGRMPIGEEMDMTQEMKLTQEYLGIFRNSQGQNKYTYHPEYHVDYTNSYIGKYEQEILSLYAPDFRDTYVATEAARYPILYYAYVSNISKPFVDSDILTRLFVMRLGGALLAFIMAYYVYATGLLIFGKAVYALTLTLMVMLMPMFSFVSAGVNSDNLHNLLFTVVIYAGLKLILKGVTFSTALTAIITIILDLYTKPQGIIAISLLLMAFLIHIVASQNWKLLIYLTFGASAVMLLGWSHISPYLGLLSAGNTRGSSFFEYLRFSSNKLLAQNVVWFWGVFKWLGVVLPPIYWRVANRVVLLSVIGFVVYLYKVIKRKKVVAPPLAISYMLLTIATYVVAIYWFDWTYTKTVGYSIGVQARYFYPVLAPIFALMLTGLLSYGAKISHRKWIRRGVLLLFLWLQLGGVITIIKSYYVAHSLNLLIGQLSQYKPWWGKGELWYLWGALYLLSLLYLIARTWSGRKKVA